MAGSNEVIEELASALKGLLTVADAKGRRILYQEDADGDHSYCHVCEEVDGHKAECAVGSAERVLRILRPEA
jgi:hypothetical protein